MQKRRSARRFDKHSGLQPAPRLGSDGGSVPSVVGIPGYRVASHHGPHETLGHEAARSGCLALSHLPQPRAERGNRHADGDGAVQKHIDNNLAYSCIAVARRSPHVKSIIDSVCHNKFSWRNVVHMRLHHSAPGRCLRLRYDVASHLQGQGRRKINIGQDEPENEEAGQDQSDDEEAGPHHHEREEAGPDKHNDEEARQNQHNDESARQDQHEEREPEQTGEGDAAGRQEQREHDGSTATSKPVDSRAEKEEEKNKDTPDTDVRRGGTGVLPQGTVGNQRPISPERPPKRQAAASEADGACLALNGIVTVSLLMRACRRLPRAAGREPNGTGSSPLDASTRAVVLAVVSQVQAAAQTQVSRRMTCH